MPRLDEVTDEVVARFLRTLVHIAHEVVRHLACGLDGNVIRLLPPLTASDEELERGLSLLEEALGDAGADRG